MRRSLKQLGIFIFLLLWFFSGWPQVWQNPPIPPKIQEALAAQSTNSPSANTGSWTNPTNAYADGGSYANITSGAPSATHTFGTYGFGLTGDVITQVRVRMDASSIGGASANQQRVPTGDDANTNAATTSPFWSKVDETSPNDADFYTMVNNTGHLTMTFAAFSVPSGSTITGLTIYYRAGNTVTNANNARASIKVNSTYYDTTDAGNDTPNSPGWTTFSYAFTTNPNTGVAWIAKDINGSGSNPLQAFGTSTTDANPDFKISMVYAQVDYTTANDETIEMDVSWDGGTSWSSSKHQQALTGSEATYWVDVTSDTAWTPTKLNDSNFKVRVDGLTAGDSGDVRLDWIPVEVTSIALPTVTTQAVSSVKDTTATGNGTIDNTGGENNDKRGFVYDTSSHSLPGNVAPTSSGYASYAEDTGSYGTGAFTKGLTSLNSGATYYARAYAHNSAGYSYGGEVSFTTAVIAISITSSGVISYGYVTPGASKDTTGGSTQTARNDSTIAENFNIKTSNATGGTQWTIGSSAGANIFVHEFSTNGGGAWTKFTDADNYQTLATGVAPSGTQSFDLRITVPTDSDTQQKTIMITVQAIAQ